MVVKIKKEFEGNINEIIEHETTPFVKPSPSHIVHRMIEIGIEAYRKKMEFELENADLGQDEEKGPF